MAGKRRSIRIERESHGPGYNVRSNNPHRDTGTYSVGHYGTYEQAKEGKRRYQESGFW